MLLVVLIALLLIALIKPLITGQEVLAEQDLGGTEQTNTPRILYNAIFALAFVSIVVLWYYFSKVRELVKGEINGRKERI